MYTNMLIAIKKIICTVFGHMWRYLNYSNHMKANGDKYDFKAARVCLCCHRQEYFYNEWIEESKSKMDFESKYFSTKHIRINNIDYK